MENDLEKIDFSSLSGRGVKVAIVDSGADKSHRSIKLRIVRGIGITVNSHGRIVYSNDFADQVGHGTACAGIIVDKASDVKLYPIKILNNNLTAKGKLLVEAINWAVDQSVDIINLSLGTTKEKWKEELFKSCERARKHNILLVSAANPKGLKSYPAGFSDVFTVYMGRIYEKYGYVYCPPNRFLARGDPQRVKWVDSKYAFFGGTSYAAPHLTGIIALLLEKYPDSSFESIKRVLIANAQKCTDLPVWPCAIPALGNMYGPKSVENRMLDLGSSDDAIDAKDQSSLSPDWNKTVNCIKGVAKKVLGRNIFAQRGSKKYGCYPLYAQLGLDNFNIIDFVDGLEDEFDIQITDEELSLDLFDSLNTLAGFIGNKTKIERGNCENTVHKAKRI